MTESQPLASRLIIEITFIVEFLSKLKFCVSRVLLGFLRCDRDLFLAGSKIDTYCQQYSFTGLCLIIVM